MRFKSSVRDAVLTGWLKTQTIARQCAGLWRQRMLRPAALLAPALLVVGAALLVFVGVQYGRMFSEQHRLAREWQRQNQPGTALKPVDEGLVKLVIPKIKLDAIVVEGTSRRQLLLGPGHMEQTPPPGEEGNAVITAHRDTFFRHVYELSKGDLVEVQRRGRVYNYQVTGKKIVDPEDLSVLRQGKDKRLTLITCYPTYYIGPAPDRLVIFAKVMDGQSAGDTTQVVAKKTAATSAAAASSHAKAQ